VTATITLGGTTFAYDGDTADIAYRPLYDVTPPKPSGPRCDFCGFALGAGYSDFWAEPFARLYHDPVLPPAGLLVAYGARWAACRCCAPHVRRRDWPTLADLVCRRRRDAGRPVPSRHRAEVAALWLQLEARLP